MARLAAGASNAALQARAGLHTVVCRPRFLGHKIKVNQAAKGINVC